MRSPQSVRPPFLNKFYPLGNQPPKDGGKAGGQSLLELRDPDSSRGVSGSLPPDSNPHTWTPEVGKARQRTGTEKKEVFLPCSKRVSCVKLKKNLLCYFWSPFNLVSLHTLPGRSLYPNFLRVVHTSVCVFVRTCASLYARGETRGLYVSTSLPLCLSRSLPSFLCLPLPVGLYGRQGGGP